MTTPTDTTTPTASIVNEPGSDMDVATTWRQVHPMTWIGMGAWPKNIVRAATYFMVWIYLGAGTHRRKLVIQLTSADLYDIELGRVWPIRSGKDYEVIEQVRGIDAENLDRTLRDLYDRHSK